MLDEVVLCGNPDCGRAIRQRSGGPGRLRRYCNAECKATARQRRRGHQPRDVWAASIRGVPRQARPRVEVEEKACARCGLSKPRRAFAPNVRLVDGLNSYCVDCDRESGPRSRFADRAVALLLTISETGVRAILRERVPKAATEAYVEALLRDPCAYCGGSSELRDHIDPRIVAGGRSGRRQASRETANLVGACEDCNKAKSDTSLLRFLLATG